MGSDDELAPTIPADVATPPEGPTRAPSDLGSLAAELRGLAATPGPHRPILEPGAVIDGIYRVEDQLGEGGMGVVFRARDLRLDREVAIKVGTAVTPAALARAEREAMALAKLSHPNVVIVHGVGELGGRLYLAMELVRGGSARGWARAAPRTAREVVELYAAAGDGLAAAHAAGLVHRDFKPDNVLVGDDGRPRVGDFGLARGADTLDDAPTLDGGGPPESDAITHTGAVLGTLGYMPPEQLGGLDLDARADQFAFCASLWEALYGARPFAGRSLREVGDAIERGLPRPPDGVKVPAHVAAAVRRGLAFDRLARWPSMAALCAELRRDPGARRRRTIAVAAGAAAIATAAAAVAFAWPRGGPSEADACDDGAAQLAHAWSPAQAAAVRARAGARAATALDDRARRWSVQYRAVCGAGARGWAMAQVAHGLECLDARRDQLAGAAALLAGGGLDPGRTEQLLNGLDAPERCADPAYLAADAPPPSDPARAAAVAAAEGSLAHARQLALVDRPKDAMAIVQAVVADARGLDYAPLLADALHARGNLETDQDSKAALADERDAYFRAQDGHARATAASSAAAVAVVMLDLSRYDDAADWARLADEAARGLGDPKVSAQAIAVGAMVASDAGDGARALTIADQALAVATPTGDVDLVRQMLYTRAGVLIAMGRPGEGADDLRKAIALVTREVGADSPELVNLDMELGTALVAMGKPTDAEPVLRAALALAEHAYGPDSERAGDVSDQLGTALEEIGRYDEALAAIRRGLAITEKTQGPRAYNTGASYANLAAVLAEMHRLDEAGAADRRAIEIFTDALGPDDHMVAQEWTNLGLSYLRADKNDDAIAALERGRAIYAKGSAKDPTFAYTLTALGSLRAERGELAVGRAELEQALALRAAPDVDPAARATTSIELAHVLWRQGDRAGATALAKAALADFAKSAHTPSDKIVPFFDQILGRGTWRATR